MIVCICRVVSDRTIREAIDRGARSVDEVAAACRAGTGCGACRETVDQMINRTSERCERAPGSAASSSSGAA